MSENMDITKTDMDELELLAQVAEMRAHRNPVRDYVTLLDRLHTSLGELTYDVMERILQRAEDFAIRIKNQNLPEISSDMRMYYIAREVSEYVTHGDVREPFSIREVKIDRARTLPEIYLTQKHNGDITDVKVSPMGVQPYRNYATHYDEACIHYIWFLFLRTGVEQSMRLGTLTREKYEEARATLMADVDTSNSRREFTDDTAFMWAFAWCYMDMHRTPCRL